MVFHSDLGSQYTRDEFSQTIKAFNMTHSFSYMSSPHDNACIESFHAILKKEDAILIRYLHYESAQLAILQYIEGWYNRNRIHSSIGYRTPQEMENIAFKIA